MIASSIQLLPRVWAILSLVCVLLIGGYHCFNMHKRLEKNKADIGKLSAMLTLSLFFFGLLRLIGFALQEFGSTAAICSFCAAIGAASYISFKSVLYLILIHRLHDVYKTSPRLGYSSNRLLVWAAINLLWGLCNMVLVVVYKLETYDATHYPYCITGVTEKWIVGMIGLQDLVAGGINIVLFVRPLFQFQQLETGKGKKLAENLRKFAVKASALSIIAIVSTILALVAIAVVEFYMMVVFIGSDVVVSILSVILMYTWNSAIYEALCCCLNRQSKEHEKNMNHLDREVNVAQSQTQMAVATVSPKQSTLTSPNSEDVHSPDAAQSEAGNSTNPTLDEHASLRLNENP